MDDYLSIHHAAAELGVSRRRLYQLIAEGKLPAARFGGRTWLVKRADLAAARARRQVKGWVKGRPRKSQPGA